MVGAIEGGSSVRALRRAVLLVVVLGVCTVWPASALASVSWSGVQEVTPNSQSSNLNDLMTVVGDPGGSTITAFQSDSGSQPGTSGFGTDTLSSGSWSPASVANGFDLGQDQPSAFAMGPDGGQAAAYVVSCPDPNTTPTCVYLAWRASGASAWGTPLLVVALPQGESTGTPAVAVDANGNATVAWLDYVNTNQSYVDAVTYDAATSSLGNVAVLSGEDYIDQAPQIVLDGDGTASVTWINGDYSAANQMQAATRAAPTVTTTDPAWSSAAALPISGSNGYTSYAFSTAQPGTTGPGSLVVALCHRDAGGNLTDGEIELLTHGSSGWTDSPVSSSDVTSCTQDWSGLFVGRDTAGTTSVGWVEPKGYDSAGYTQADVLEADQASDGSWSAITDLTGGTVPFNSMNISSQLVRPVFAEDPNGDLVAAWARPADETSNYSTQNIFADVRPAGGSFSGPQQVAQDGDPSSSVQAQVLAVSPAIDGNRDATVIWEHFVGATTPQTQDLRAVSTTAPIGSSSGSATPTPTSLSLGSAPNPSVIGQTVTITATVSPAVNEGTVDFKDGSTTISGCGSVAVTSGQATCSYAFTSPGPHSLEADYSGDSNYVGSSQTGDQQVNPPATSTGLISSGSPSSVGQNVTFTASVSPTPDGGTIAFTDNGNPISGCATVSVNSSGHAACSETINSAGSHTVEATYSGDTNFAGSSQTTSQQVNPAATSTGLTSSASPSTVGQRVTFTAQLSPMPDGGTVAFTDNGATISGCGSVSVSTATGKASCSETINSTGSHSVKAVYSGDGNYQGSSHTITQTVKLIRTATSATGAPSPGKRGKKVKLIATVGPNPQGGTVTFARNGSAISNCANLPVDPTSGQASCDHVFKRARKYTLTATFSGDARYAGSSTTFSETIK